MRRTIIPTLRYDDAPAAIEFLVAAFGFEATVEHRAGDIVMHAQLTWGDGMVMLGSTDRGDDDEFGRLVTTVAEAGLPTSSPYVIVEDVHGIADRARAAGGEVVMEPEDQDHGGVACAVRDPEGNLWNFGSYDPWAEVES